MNTHKSPNVIDSPLYKLYEDSVDAGDYDRALEVTRLLQVEYPLSPMPFVIFGNIHSDMQQWEVAYGYYQQALDKDARVWTEPDPEGIRASAMFALDCATAVFGAYYGCGVCLLNMNRHTEAISHFKECLDQGPDDSEIRELIEYTESLMAN